MPDNVITVTKEKGVKIARDADSIKEENGIQQARKQVVAQRTDLVQKSKGRLTRLQGLAIRYMISKVKPDDSPHQKYTFSFREFSMIMRYKTDSYSDIKNMLQAIRDISWWKDADDPNDDDILMSWFNIVHVNERKGTATISFHEDVFPYILNLQEQYEKEGRHYFQYLLQNISLMKGIYSADLYELLRSYANNKEWTFEVGTGTTKDIQLRLAKKEIQTGKPIIPESWKNWAIFERDVLKPSKREINTYSDIVIDYIPSKIDFSGRKYRRYVCVKFLISLKTKSEQENTNNLIDTEYKEIEDSGRYRQLTIQDVFTINRMSAKEQDEQEVKIRAEEMAEADLDNYRYPAFKACLPGFSDEELDYLYAAAMEHLGSKRINFANRELWATDYVTHYCSLVKATAGDTKTTTYKRLLDMVRKDYDNFAVQIVAYDNKEGVPIRKLEEHETEVVENDAEDMTADEIRREILKLQNQLNKKMEEE